MSLSRKPTRAPLAHAPVAERGGAVIPPRPQPVESVPPTTFAISPPGLDEPRGFSHGWLSPAGVRILFVSGQTAADADGHVAEPDFVAQFETAVVKSLAVVAAAGGQAEHVVRMTVYVTDMDAYLRSRKEVGERWRRHMGRHYPAMSLVEVSSLVDAEAVVEIEVTAAVPEQ